MTQDHRPTSSPTSRPERARAQSRERDPVVLHLVRTAVALHAEDLLRTIGALAQQDPDVGQWVGLIERDVHDLCLLVAASVRAGARLPAGFDIGEGEPGDPGSAMEGLLASHEALTDVLSHLAQRASDPTLARLSAELLDRRDEETQVLRSLGAGRGLPEAERLIQGSLEKFQA